MSRICPKCGAENRDSAKFCLMCTHQLAPIRQITPRTAAAMARRRNRRRRGYPLEVTQIVPDSDFPPSVPFVTPSVIASPSRVKHTRRGGSTGWFMMVGLGTVLILGSLAWTVAANRSSHSRAPALAQAMAQAPVPLLPPAAPASAEQIQATAQQQTHPAVALSAPSANSTAQPTAGAPTKSPVPDDDQARKQLGSDSGVEAATAPESASKARPARRSKPKPAPRPKAVKPDRPPPAQEEHVATVAASAPEPAASHVLCSGDAVSQTICLMRACDQPANAHSAQCVQFQQRANALRNASGNRPYYY